MSTTTAPRPVPGFDDLERDWLRARGSVKWHRPGPRVLPAWVADMDFPVPAAVTAALRDAVDRRDLGYPDWPDGSPLRTAFARRMADRYGWAAAAERVREQTDLIQCLQLVLHLATGPGDAVAVQTPNYPPFLATLSTMGRRAVPVPMQDTDTGWHMDLAALDAAVARKHCKVLVLVNPHNPTGRVLTHGELEEIAAIARRHDLLVISDEIHAELTYAPHRHIPFASLSPDAARRTVTLTSATKAFNLAAIRCALTHYGPDRLLALRDAQPPDLYGTVSPLGVVATQAAWREGDAWQRELLTVLDRNRRRVHQVLHAQLPQVRHHLPEATYLAWIDTRPLGLGEPPVERVLKTGNVLLDGGSPFGPDADGFLRLNFATSHAVLEDVLAGVTQALAPPRNAS
ncbi:MalY/PatB family protein [Streptomyces cylindrosporus]|uniref:cysteine-S-conjugate beta-lyase n=1 Tax=Streptomyces cylindrosporus TaxID=2927583 RepID=A0ABS9YKK9_9ACTN|nr:aminotransferase class I/II-fold pyridoxal phosphate-dependent enzyme [Streptomyces cylindrosporus]MCI3277805.1 aminotransferase class I/II-fold pyridoxal phosphate-dependent enzyme [Streptomyces cylindrosporus]